jgi:hypothetical protein
MSQILSTVAVIGIDIGKNSFHVVGQDGGGVIVLRQKGSRGQVEARCELLDALPAEVCERRNASRFGLPGACEHW